MKNSIIFKIDIDKKLGGFERASNFITKMSENQRLSELEVKGITSIQYEKTTGENLIVAEYVIKEMDKFKIINKPEFLDVAEKYNIYYCLWLTDNSLHDVIDLQYDYLIKKFFTHEKIFTILSGNQDIYFKTSHYLYTMSQEDGEWYNSFLYLKKENGLKKLIRLQKNNVSQFNRFMPFQYFSENDRKIFRKLSEVVSKETILKVLEGKEVKPSNVPVILRAGIRVLSIASDTILPEEAEELCNMISTGDVFQFLLFAYSCSNKDFWKKYNLEEIKTHYFKIKECAVACEQLMENVINHSVAKAGGISIRFHEADAEYLVKRYNLENNSTQYVEVLVTDYEGVNSKGNIAENFLENIDDEDKIKLKELQPTDFFIDSITENDERKSIKEALTEISLKSNNIGKHIGLKIFKSIVEENKGLFGFYSHTNHIIKKGENYNFYEYSSMCIPGTGYTILFPIMIEEGYMESRANISIDFNINIENKIREYVEEYCCIEKSIEDSSLFIKNQNEKENLISKMSTDISYPKYNEEKKRHIIYISAKNIDNNMAEYICKALIVASNRSPIADYVFYDCSKEFLVRFQSTAVVYFGIKELAYIYKNREFVIALYTASPIESLFIIPGNYKRTIWVNQTNCYSGSEYMSRDWLSPYKELYSFQEENLDAIPPYDIIYKTKEGSTIFEKYTSQVLENNIQEKAFGCKMTNTHMRLGSTIHINSFYEAELLFSNRLFANRFAYLLVKDISNNSAFIESAKITLYSYALYSETLVVETMDLLKLLYPKKEIDYAILEREAEHREFLHMDRIRYGKNFKSKEERNAYYEDRKIICIVPINSTLKTHEKLLTLFIEENNKVRKENVILNYALILVGSNKPNNYWEIDETEKIIDSRHLKEFPKPKYFIKVLVDYYEANDCELCFPNNPINEQPLIEVNAASTIPNQSFGLYKKENRIKIDYNWIKLQEEDIKELKDVLIYRHTIRGENHFLYYFKTDELFLNQKKDITKWLYGISQNIKIDVDEYHILFCPMHYSNAGFAESVNRIVFHDAALLIRTDVDKEYRSNICAKYSNLSSLIEILENRGGGKRIIKIHYVDDSIVTGRTFHRAKSLVSSIVKKYNRQSNMLDIHIFESIFVLLDRNSAQSRLQYVNCWDNVYESEELLKKGFYAYKTLYISSMRSHGDSCVLCQLEREANILYCTSATKCMTKYWENQKKKFAIKYLRDKQEESSTIIGSDKAFRRMFCYHIAEQTLLGGEQSNKADDTIDRILTILYIDYNGRKEEQGQEIAFEYFLSYLKIISRPFLVFDKMVKEAVFDIQLIMSERLLDNEIVLNIDKKRYLEKHIGQLNNVLEIIEEFPDKQKTDLLKLLIKQLTEMKSNYFIRSNNISCLAEYAETLDKIQGRELYERFLQQTKKLLGVSSDTSKSSWFNKQMYGKEERLGLPDDILTKLIIENTRCYYDGLEKLNSGKNIDNLKKELQKAQYRDFVSDLVDRGLINEKEEISDEGEEEIKAAVALLNICKKNIKTQGEELSEKKIEGICQEIVELIKKILEAKYVNLLLECPLECAKWEDDLKSRYNALIRKHNEWELEEIKLSNKKEYLLIAASGENRQTIQIIRNADNKVGDRLISYYQKSKQQGLEGIYVDVDDKYMVWEIGNEEQKLGDNRKLLIYAEYENIQLPQEWYRIRSLLCMNHLLHESVFNNDVINYLFELILADKRVMINELDKAHSHTNETIRNAQTKCARSLKMQEAYHSFVLILLSDLQVSQVYRNSLKAEYYCNKSKAFFRKYKNIFLAIDDKKIMVLDQNQNGVYYNQLYVKLKKADDYMGEDEEALGEDEYLISWAIANGENEVFLLLLSLILNAAVQGRGRRERIETEESTDTKRINVYVSKSKGCLRISNIKEFGEERSDEINKEIQYPPQPNKGISLWSVSRYIKGIISSLLNQRIDEMEKKDLDNLIEKKDLDELKKTIETYTGKDYDINVKEYTDEELNKVFCIDIPILQDKYKEFEKEISRN